IPTCNRQHFFDLIIANIERIEYPKHKIEVIIVDDSDKKSTYFDNRAGIRYVYLKEKVTIGKKRNILCELAKHEYIIHMDDDDWYFPISVISRLRVLMKFNKDGCVGCSRVQCIDLYSNRMFEAY